MTNSFKISDLSSGTLVGRDIGQKTREKIEKLIDEHGKIFIDLENNASLSPSFVDEAFINLVLKYGKKDFSEKIVLINIDNGMRSMMNSILHNKIHRKKIADPA